MDDNVYTEIERFLANDSHTVGVCLEEKPALIEAVTCVAIMCHLSKVRSAAIMAKVKQLDFDKGQYSAARKFEQHFIQAECRTVLQKKSIVTIIRFFSKHLSVS